MASKSVINIGIVSFAHMHAHGYAQCLGQFPNVNFVGVVDDDAARARKMGKQYGVKVFATYEDMLASDIDAVVVCSENSSHRKHVVMAAQSEKHVLCEKPLATSMYDAEAIVEVCKRSAVKLQIAYPCRFHPAFVELKRSVKAGELGKILGIKATNQGMCPRGWFIDKKLAGGGAVLDHTVHLVDLIRCMTGADPARVYAEIDNRMYGQEFDDTGLISVDFTNGVFATIDASWSRLKNSPFWGNVNMDVIGTGGMARMEMFAQKIDLISDAAGRLTYEYWGDDTSLALVGSFVRSIAEDTGVEITGEDGVKSLEVALAAYDSAQSGKPVDLLE